MTGRQGLFEDLLEIGSKPSWKVAFFSAGGAFLLFHFVAIGTSVPATTTILAGLGIVVGHSYIICSRPLY